MAFYLITGASGRLGRCVLPKLVRKGRVRAVLRPESSFKLPARVERFSWDMSTPLPRSAFENITHVVHLAGLVGDHPYEELLLNNGTAVRNLLANCPSSVKRIVLASSISIYGDYAGKTVDESFVPKGESPYGKSKLMGEMAASEYCGALPIVFLRFGMIYGPGFEEGYFDVLRRIESGKAAIIGNGRNRIPLLHSDDATAAILLSLEKKIQNCRAYNVVGSESPTQEGLVSLAASELGAPKQKGRVSLALATALASLKQFLFQAGLSKKPSFTPENIRQLTLDRTYSAALAKAELGFVAKVKLRQGLKQVVREYLAKGRKR